MKKILALMLVFVLVFSLAACNQTEPAETNESEESETPVSEVQKDGEVEVVEAAGLDEIKANGKIVLGTSADYPPYEFHTMVDGKDAIVGFDIEFAKAIAEELGVELEIQDMAFDAVLAGVQTGLLDMGIAGINPDPERAEIFDFTDIYFESQYCVLVSSDKASEFTKAEDLNGKSIGVQTGTIQEGIVNDNLQPGNVVSLGKVTDLVMQLKSGMIDAIVLEVPVADSYAGSNPDIAVIKEIDFTEFEIEGGSAVAIQKGNTELVEAINEVIAKLKDEGKIDEWYAEAVKLADTSEGQ